MSAAAPLKTTVFSPPRFEVVEIDGDRGAVVHEDSRFAVVWTENDGALHAVATSDPEQPHDVLTGWRRLAAGEIASGDPDAPR